MVAVLVLGAIALRTTLQIEKTREQSVFEATLTLADERVDRLDKLIVAQDNVVLDHVDLAALTTIARRWLPTATRETPTVRAIVVVDLRSAEHEVLAFASRLSGPEDDTFRRMLVTQLIPQMNFSGNTDELRHLHQVIGDHNLLVSYWQRSHAGRPYLIVAWHDVPRIVHEVMPSIYRDPDKGNARMNVIDEEGRIVFGPPIKGGEFTVGRSFPTTLYNWRVQTALTTAEELAQKVERQRMIELGMVAFAGLVAILGVSIIVVASVKERKLAALKSDFVANVSHELKTPLSLIRMFSELLLLDRITNDDKRKQYLQIIVNESERLTSLIENVLDFAKVERGKAAYEFALGDVGETVSRAVEVYRYRAEREAMDVSLTIAGDLPFARIDARAIELAVINLLDNALKYAKEGGRVELQVEHVGDTIRVRVTDHGPGISEEDKPRIFERFVRGHHAREAKIRGSGIGLALVKHIAESHGGRVRVTSPTTPGGTGAAFEIELPCGAPSHAPRATAT